MRYTDLIKHVGDEHVQALESSLVRANSVHNMKPTLYIMLLLLTSCASETKKPTGPFCYIGTCNESERGACTCVRSGTESCSCPIGDHLGPSPPPQIKLTKRCPI